MADWYAMTVGLVLKIAPGLGCFVIGAASLIGAIGSLLFVSASDAHIPAMLGRLGRYFCGLLICCYDEYAGTTTNSLRQWRWK